MPQQISYPDQNNFVHYTMPSWHHYNSKTSFKEDAEGLKIHFGINRDNDNYQKSLDIIIPLLCEADSGIKQFKIWSTSEKPNGWSENAFGKEVCIYLHEGYEPNKILNLLQTIENKLSAQNIPPAPKPPEADRIIPGSLYNIGYRFDKPYLTKPDLITGTPRTRQLKYLSAEIAFREKGETAYNPGNPSYTDPFANAVLLHTSSSKPRGRISNLFAKELSSKQTISDINKGASFREKLTHFRKMLAEYLNSEYPAIKLPEDALVAKHSNGGIYLPFSECAKLPETLIAKLDSKYKPEILAVKKLYSDLTKLDQSLMKIDNKIKIMKKKQSSQKTALKRHEVILTQADLDSAAKEFIGNEIKGIKSQLAACKSSLYALDPPEKNILQKIAKWFTNTFSIKQIFSSISQPNDEEILSKPESTTRMRDSLAKMRREGHQETKSEEILTRPPTNQM